MLLPLILTILTEGLVMYMLTHSGVWCKYNLYCNMVTNPLINLAVRVTYRLFQNPIPSFWLPLIAGEVAVVYAEMRIYEEITLNSRGICFKYSLVTNSVSALIGLIIVIATGQV